MSHILRIQSASLASRSVVMVGATALAYPGDPSLGPYGPLSLRADALGMRGHTQCRREAVSMRVRAASGLSTTVRTMTRNCDEEHGEVGDPHGSEEVDGVRARPSDEKAQHEGVRRKERVGGIARSEDRIHRVERTFRKFTDHREVLPNVARSLLVDRLNNEKNAVERHPG